MPRVSQVVRLIERVSPPIPNPDPKLEQYTTPGEIAARLAQLVKLHGFIGSSIADLGAGTCRLTLALSLFGASKLVPVDADRRLAKLCLEAYEAASLEPPSYIVSWISRDRGPLSPGSVRVIVMNPPFGVQRRGADTEFLLYAMSISPERIYAILKTGNEEYHTRLAGEHGYRHMVIYTEWFPIPAVMKHHRSRIKRVKVNVSLFKRI